MNHDTFHDPRVGRGGEKADAASEISRGMIAPRIADITDDEFRPRRELKLKLRGIYGDKIIISHKMDTLSRTIAANRLTENSKFRENVGRRDNGITGIKDRKTNSCVVKRQRTGAVNDR